MPSRSKSQLTPTEWKIAIAIAEGMENKEIAESCIILMGT